MWMEWVEIIGLVAGRRKRADFRLERTRTGGVVVARRMGDAEVVVEAS